eukprot:scaffold1558_cov403-Prasinococcus_capsulatus_cf.AAC.7
MEPRWPGQCLNVLAVLRARNSLHAVHRAKFRQRGQRISPGRYLPTMPDCADSHFRSYRCVFQVASVPGLRIDGQRLFRARYPNVNSMTTGDIRIAGGSAAWVAPKDMGTPSYYTSNLTREGTADGEFSK